jgi:hypothetical protein
MTVEQLETKIGPLDRRDLANYWRYGILYKRSWDGLWAETLEQVSLRPNESLYATERDCDGVVAIVDE